MKPLKWWEPWALTRRRGWRKFLRLIVRSSIPKIYGTLSVVAIAGGWWAHRVICPTCEFPYIPLILAWLICPAMILLGLVFIEIVPLCMVLRPDRYGYFAEERHSVVKPIQLLAWRMQARRGYRRLVLRYVSDWGIVRRRVSWLPLNVDLTELERRMRDFMARGEHERAKAGRP